MPWDETRGLSGALWFDGPDVLFRGELPGQAPAGVCTPGRWRPGSEPLPEGSGDLHHRHSGLVSGSTAQGVLVRWPDGFERTYAVAVDASLTPAGDALAYWLHSPPAVTLWEVDRSLPDPRPRVLPLPEGTAVPGPAATGQHVWEDARTVLLHGERYGPAPAALRLDLVTGRCEQVPLGDDGDLDGETVVFVEGLPQDG